MKIQKINARKILNSRGKWTIEVQLMTSDKRLMTTSVPEGVSAGSHEAAYVSPDQAVKNIEKIIQPLLQGMNPNEQAKIDEKLIEKDGTKNKSKLGANAILGVSMACARAGAMSAHISLWKHIRNLHGKKFLKNTTARLFALMIEGGLHAQNGLDFQEFLVIPKTKNISDSVRVVTHIHNELKNYLLRHKGLGATGVGDEGAFAPSMKNNLEPFVILQTVIKKLGLENKMQFGLDAAGTNVKLSREKLFSIYATLITKFHLWYLEDPFEEEDFENFARFRKQYGKNILITGDDLTTTNLSRMGEAELKGSINCIIIKPNQIGTVTEAIEAVREAREMNWSVVASHRGGETNDDFIADFAYGVCADGIKLGAPTRGERIAKYNRFLAIELESKK